MKFKAAAVHAAPVFMDKNATVEKACNFIKEAGGAGIELLVFPETFIPGYPYWIECYPLWTRALHYRSTSISLSRSRGLRLSACDTLQDNMALL